MSGSKNAPPIFNFSEKIRTKAKVDAAKLRKNGTSWAKISAAISEKYECSVSPTTIRNWEAARVKTLTEAGSLSIGKQEAEKVEQAGTTIRNATGQPGGVAEALRGRLIGLAESAVGSVERLEDLAQSHRKQNDQRAELDFRELAVESFASVSGSVARLAKADVLDFREPQEVAAKNWAVDLAMGIIPKNPEWSLYPHQRLVLWERNQYVVVHGGIGTRKSTACILRLLLHCHRHPGQRLVVAAKTFRQLQMVFLEQWRKFVPKDLYAYNGSEYKLTIPGCDAVLWLAYEGKPDSWQMIHGTNLSGYYGIQPETWVHAVFIEELEERTRAFEGNDEAMFRLFDCNAGAPDHIIHKWFLDPESDLYQGGDGSDSKPVISTPYQDVTQTRHGLVTVFHIPTTAENSVYGQDRLDRFKRTLPEHRYQQMILGQWVAVSGQVYDSVKVSDISWGPSDVLRFWIGLDPGTDKNDADKNDGNLALVVVGELENGSFAVLDERRLGYSGLTALVDVVKSLVGKWGPDKFKFVVNDWGGGSGVPMGEALTEAGFSVLRPGGDTVRAKYFRVTAGSALLYEAFATELLVVSESCKLVQEDLRKYSNGSGGEPDKNIYDPHLLDALRYLWIRVSRLYSSDPRFGA